MQGFKGFRQYQHVRHGHGLLRGAKRGTGTIEECQGDGRSTKSQRDISPSPPLKPEALDGGGHGG